MIAIDWLTLPPHSIVNLTATALLCGLSLTACKTTPGAAPTVSQPSTPIARTMTNFSNAKRCMDQLLLEGNRNNISIAVDDIRDATQSVSVSTQDMVLSALSDMSIRSKAFNVYVKPKGTGIVNAFLGEKVAAHKRPGIYIRGSISQADNAIAQDDRSASVVLPSLSLGGGDNQTLSTLSLDLQLVYTQELTIVPGGATSNTITIISSGDSTSSRGLLNSGSFAAGLSISLSNKTREGKSQAVRTLIEFSVIELLGRYTGVPYQRCFQLDSTDPLQVKMNREVYDKLKPDEQIRSIQLALRSSGEYRGAADGVKSQEFATDISAAKNKRGLIPNGRVDFQLFNALIDEGLLNPNTLSVKINTDGRDLSDNNFQTINDADPIGLVVMPVNAFPRLKENIGVRVTTKQPAYVYCYYEYRDADKKLVTARIFPGPDDNQIRTQSGIPVSVPGKDADFVLEVDSKAPHAIGCVATQLAYTNANRPAILRQPALSALSCGYPGVACAVREHQLIDTNRTSVKTVTFEPRF
jgi:hypothetical protein